MKLEKSNLISPRLRQLISALMLLLLASKNSNAMEASSFFLLCEAGTPKEIQAAIENGEDPNQDYKGITPRIMYLR